MRRSKNLIVVWNLFARTPHKAERGKRLSLNSSTPSSASCNSVFNRRPRLNSPKLAFGIHFKARALMERVDQTLSAIAAAPHSYPIVYRSLRRAVVRQFPFAIFYEPCKSEIVVFAVYHSRRDPERLISRF